MLNVMDFRISRFEAVIEFWPQPANRWVGVSRSSESTIAVDLWRVRLVLAVLPTSYVGPCGIFVALVITLLTTYSVIFTSQAVLADEVTIEDFYRYNSHFVPPHR